jgi:hypothetical protein
MPTPADSGTLAATGGEDTLATVAVAGNYVLKVDASAMQAGDAITLRIYTRVLSGGTDRVEIRETFIGAQNNPIITSIPIDAPHRIQATLHQIAGTLRSFPWSLDEVSA